MSKTPAKLETLGIPELAAKLADTHDLTKARTKAMMDDLRDNIVSGLLEGHKVSIFGLGTFEVRATKAKVGRNPKTGQKIDIPAGRKVVFKAAKGLKEQM